MQQGLGLSLLPLNRIECNPLQGPYVDKVIKKLERSEYYDRISYVDETYFDYQTITREMIDSREY